jgi:hypothetical protein
MVLPAVFRLQTIHGEGEISLHPARGGVGDEEHLRAIGAAADRFDIIRSAEIAGLQRLDFPPLQGGLGAGEVGDPCLAGFPPGLVLREVGAPLSHDHAGFHAGPRLVRELVQHHAVHAEAERGVAHVLEASRCLGPLAHLRGSGEGLGFNHGSVDLPGGAYQFIPIVNVHLFVR